MIKTKDGKIFVKSVTDPDLSSLISFGDVVFAINGAPLGIVSDHKELVAKVKPLGRPVKITFQRAAVAWEGLEAPKPKVSGSGKKGKSASTSKGEEADGEEHQNQDTSVEEGKVKTSRQGRASLAGFQGSSRETMELGDRGMSVMQQAPSQQAQDVVITGWSARLEFQLRRLPLSTSHCGWLESKRGGGLFKGWRPYWVVLMDQQLFFLRYPHLTLDQSQLEVPLTSVSSVPVVTEVNVKARKLEQRRNDEIRLPSRECVLTLRTSKGRLSLRCPRPLDPSSQALWFSKITAAVQQEK